MKTLVSLLLTLTLVISASTVSIAAEPAADEAKTVKAVAAEPQIPNTDAVVITVNGKKITRGQIESQVSQQMKRFDKAPAEQQAMIATKVRSFVVDNVIIETLLDKMVEDNKIVVTEQMVMDDLNINLKKNRMTMDTFKQFLAQQGATLADVKEQIHKNLSYRKLIDKYCEGKVDVTDEQIKKYYDEHVEEFKQQAEVKASHILIKPDAEAEDKAQAKADAKAKAEALLKQVREGGDFAQLAKDNSACPSGSRGGDLGFFSEGRMVKPFSDAAFAMKVGQVSDIVETQFGYHIIKVTDKKEAKTFSLADKKAEIKEGLESQEKGKLAEEYVAQLKDQAKIEYVDKTYEPKPEEPAPAQKAPATAETK